MGVKTAGPARRRHQKKARNHFQARASWPKIGSNSLRAGVMARDEGKGVRAMSDVPIYVIERVNRWSSSDAGDMIQIETKVEGGSIVVLRTAYSYAARLAQSIIQAAAIAEKKQKQMPGQGIELVTPYMASDVRTGHTLDNQFVALNFQTTEGVPIQVAMQPSLARETIERLTNELSQVATDQPQKLS
jgi:hypothetical protein